MAAQAWQEEPQSDFLRRLRSSQERILGQLFRAARGAEAAIDRYTAHTRPPGDRLLEMERLIVGNYDGAEGIAQKISACISEGIDRFLGSYRPSHLSALEESAQRLTAASAELCTLQRRTYDTRDELMERYKEIQLALGEIAAESQKLEGTGKTADAECTAMEADITRTDSAAERAALRVGLAQKLQDKSDAERMLGHYGRKVVFYDAFSSELLQYANNLNDLLDLAEEERSLADESVQQFGYVKASEKANVRLARGIAHAQGSRQEFHARMDKLSAASLKARMENSRLIRQGSRYALFSGRHLEDLQAVVDANHRHRNYQNMRDYEQGREILERR